MENDVIDSLQDIGYGGTLKDETLFLTSVEEGVRNSDFRELVVWTCSELKTLLNLDETVSNVTHDEDISGFVMEVSSLLKELACPYKDLVDGPVSERLGKKQQRLLLLEFLLSELMAARMVSVDRPNKAPELRIRETSTAKDLKAILLALQFPKPPDNITVKALFEKVQAKLKEVLSRAPAELSGKPLLVGRLSEEQWKILSQVHDELQQEYRLRREMLLRRLDVTVQSFQWSERAKGKEDAIAKQYVEKRGNLAAEPNVNLSDIIAARQDLAIIEKTSGSNARKNTQSSVNKVIIGRVPDRGGRPSEQEAPPPEMPSWKKDRAQGGGGGGGGGFGGGGRGGGGGGQFSRGGGRVQGNWNSKDDRQQDNSRDARRGDYNDRGSHRQDNRGDRGGYGHDNRGGYSHDNRGGDKGYYGHDNRGDDNRGNDRGGYGHDNRGGGYRGGGGHRGGRGRGRGNY